MAALLLGAVASQLVPGTRPPAMLVRVLLTQGSGVAAALLLAPDQMWGSIAPVPPPMPFLLWTLAVLAGVLASAGIAYGLARWRGWARPDFDKLAPFLAGRAGIAQGVVAASAGGALEEWLFRGWLQGVLTGLLGGPGAALGQAVLFGLLHAYQGRTGMILTGLGGVAFGLAAWASGSLWPGIAAHVLINAVNIFALGLKVNGQSRDSVSASASPP